MPGVKNISAEREKKKKSPWTDQETEKFNQFLIENINQAGLREGSRMKTRFFIHCAEFVGSRDAKQCKNHFYKSRDPKKVNPVYECFFLSRQKQKEDSFKAFSGSEGIQLASKDLGGPKTPGTKEETWMDSTRFISHSSSLEDESRLITEEERQQLLLSCQSSLFYIKELRFFAKAEKILRNIIYLSLDKPKRA